VKYPRAFVSYSWDNEDHKTWVRRLASRLRENGIDVILDQWDAYAGMDLPAYMETGVRETDFVLLVCTPQFARKANEGTGGVGYEKRILTGEIFSGVASPRKFVPVLRSGSATVALPSFLVGALYIDFSNDRDFEKGLVALLHHLYGVAPHPRPPLGSKPYLVGDWPETLTNYRKALPLRFRQELGRFVNLGYVPIRLSKTHQHQTARQHLLAEHGFDPFFALAWLRDHSERATHTHTTSLAELQLVLRLLSESDEDCRWQDTQRALDLCERKGASSVQDAIGFLETLTASEPSALNGEGGLSLEEVVKSQQYVLIIGEPGSGKTISCYRITQLPPQQFDVDNIFYVEASRFRAFLRADPSLPAEDGRIVKQWLAKAVRDSMYAALREGADFTLSHEVILEELERGRSLLLVDGLNELGGLSNDLVSLIEAAMSDVSFDGRGLGGNRYVLTTRKYNDPVTRLASCTRHQILPLSDHAIDDLIAQHEAAAELQIEIKRLSPEMRTNPLFLDLAIGIYKKSGRIPYNWGSLFQSFLNNFLYDWERKTLERSSEIILGEAGPALEELAYSMTCRNLVQVEWAEALQVLKRRLGLDGDRLGPLVTYLLDGRLIRRDGSSIRFMGQPLQECLTASHVKRLLDRNDTTLDAFYDGIRTRGEVTPQWYGSVFLLTNQLTADQISHVVDLLEADQKLRDLVGSVTVFHPDKFSGRAIIKVTNYYCNAKAQMEAYAVFDYLYKNYGLKVICVEGAEGEINTAWFRAFPNKEIRGEVAQYFVKKGEITAPEYLSITADYPVLLYGVEDKELYQKLYAQELDKEAPPDDSSEPASMEARKHVLVANTLKVMEREGLRLAAFYYGGGGALGQIWPKMVTDQGAVYVEIGTKSTGVNWDLYKKVFRGEKTPFEELLAGNVEDRNSQEQGPDDAE